MKSEFWAEFDLGSEAQKRNLIHYFVGSREHAPSSSRGIHWTDLEDLAARQHLLAQLLASEEECDGRTNCKDYAKGKNGLQQWYHAGDLQNQRDDFQTFLDKRTRWMAPILSLTDHKITVSPSFPNLTLFPPGSWAVQLTFTLRKPYLSKDDVDFYILDNPVKKEWVFKVPYVAPSQWKGALRAAMRRLRGYTLWEEETQDGQMVRLFGNVKGEENEFSAGRLHFYPTFFDKIGLEVINPHDRKTGAGKNPIYFECVPADTQGVFTLLYVPLDLSDNPDEAREQAVEDLKAVARGIHAMLTVYGFGAKTSSGYGVAEEYLEDGKLVLRAPDIQPSSPTAATEVVEPEEAFYKYLDDSGEVKSEFKGHGEGGLMSNSEYKQKGASLGGGSLGEFKRFRAWYISHGEAWKHALHSAAAGSEEPITERTFSSLDELVRLSDDLLQANQNGAKGGEDA